VQQVVIVEVDLVGFTENRGALRLGAQRGDDIGAFQEIEMRKLFQ